MDAVSLMSELTIQLSFDVFDGAAIGDTSGVDGMLQNVHAEMLQLKLQCSVMCFSAVIFWHFNSFVTILNRLQSQSTHVFTTSSTLLLTTHATHGL